MSTRTRYRTYRLVTPAYGIAPLVALRYVLLLPSERRGPVSQSSQYSATVVVTGTASATHNLPLKTCSTDMLDIENKKLLNHAER